MKQIIINSFYLLCFTCILYSCTYNINSFDKQKVHFDELPLSVQNTLIVLSEQRNRSLDFIFLENKNRYDTRILKSGPFIDGYEFTDNEKGKRYKIKV